VMVNSSPGLKGFGDISAPVIESSTGFPAGAGVAVSALRWQAHRIVMKLAIVSKLRIFRAV
jgi:hypothetical protein